MVFGLISVCGLFCLFCVLWFGSVVLVNGGVVFVVLFCGCLHFLCVFCWYNCCFWYLVGLVSFLLFCFAILSFFSISGLMWVVGSVFYGCVLFWLSLWFPIVLLVLVLISCVVEWWVFCVLYVFGSVLICFVFERLRWLW